MQVSLSRIGVISLELSKEISIVREDSGFFYVYFILFKRRIG